MNNKLDDICNTWHVMKIGIDLQETSIKAYANSYHAVDVMNRYARMKGMKFKSDDSLFGGYWVDYNNSDHPCTCYWIQ